jgi:hypothetical protein
VKWWKDEASNYPKIMRLTPDLYTEDNLALMRRGRGAIGPDGFPLELHHPNGLPWEDLVPMTRTGHRLGTNYLLNHPWLDTKKMADIFAYGIGREGRYAGVFAGDDDVSWFYFHDLDEEGPAQILGAVQVYRGIPNFTEADVDVRWNDDQTEVAVFIKGELGAYFDLVRGWGYPGTYSRTQPKLQS